MSLVALVASAAGCSLVTSLSGFSSGDPPTPDGGVAADGVADGAVAIDSESVDAGRLGLCDQAELYCATYDDDASEPTFEELEVSPGGSLALDVGAFASAPRSLRATMPAHPEPPGVAQFHARGSRFYPVTTRAPIRVDLDLRIDEALWTAATTGNFSLFHVGYFEKEEHVFSQELFVQSTQTAVTTFHDGEPSYSSTAPFPIGVWTHVRLETDPRPPTATLRLWIGGAQTPAIDLADLATTGTGADTLRVVIGIGRYPNGPTPAISVRYDNVIVRTI